MPSAALVQLESLLSARKLDHTLASQRGDLAANPAASGTFDDLPRGQISEIVGPRSSGRQAVLMAWLATATARGELTALVDPLDMFDPPSAAACGVTLTRLLWVRGRALGPDRVSLPREAGEVRVQVEQAVKALNLILQSGGPQRGSRAGVESGGPQRGSRAGVESGDEAGGFGLVALDLGDVPLSVIGRLPFTTWRRLHRVIAGGETACVVIAAESVARSVGGVTVALETKQQAAGSRQPAVGPHHVRVFSHREIEGRLVSARGMRTERFALSLDAEHGESCGRRKAIQV